MLNAEDAAFLVRRIKVWRRNPVVYVKEVFNVEPTEQQKEFLKAMAQSGAKVSVKSGHGTGKTTCFAWLIFWFLTCYSPAKIPVTAPTSAQLRDALWAEAKMWWNKMPPQIHDLFLWTSERITCLDTGSFAVARTASKERPEALQGIHADNILFLIDEASAVYEEVFVAAGSAMSAENARVAMASNPTVVSGYFYNSHNINRNLWTRLTFNGEKSPRVSKDYIESIANEYGVDSDVYRVRVLGDFPLQGDLTFIGRDLVNAACERFYRKEDFQFAPVILGCDPAYSGKDETVIALRQGIHSKIVYHAQKTDDTVKTAHILAELQDKYNAQAVFIDAGYGTGIKDIGVNMGRAWQIVWFNNAPTDPGFKNKRAEMWGKMKKWLQDGGCIERDETLINDILSVEAFINDNGQIQLVKKDKLEKSPDRGDALALTFAFPVAASAYKTGKPVMCNTNYSFF